MLNYSAAISFIFSCLSLSLSRFVCKSYNLKGHVCTVRCKRIHEHLPFFGRSLSRLMSPTVGCCSLHTSWQGTRRLPTLPATPAQRQSATGYRVLGAGYPAKQRTHIILIDLQLSAGNDDIFIIRLFYQNILNALQVAVHFRYQSYSGYKSGSRSRKKKKLLPATCT